MSINNKPHNHYFFALDMFLRNFERSGGVRNTPKHFALLHIG